VRERKVRERQERMTRESEERERVREREKGERKSSKRKVLIIKVKNKPPLFHPFSSPSSLFRLHAHLIPWGWTLAPIGPI